MRNIDEDYFKIDKNQKGKLGIKELVDMSEDEQLLWTGKPNKKVYILEQFFKMFPIALLWLLFDGGFIVGISIGVAKGAIPLFVIAILVIFFAIHLTPVWIWLSHVLTAAARLKNIEYGFTNKRIIIKSGLLVGLTSITYSEIASVNLRVGLLDRMFHVGDIIIKTSDGSMHYLEDLENPYVLTERLQAIVIDIKTDIEFPNDLRPETNSGYKTKYKGKGSNDFD